MSQIVVWKCDEDGKIFEDKKKYQNHLRKLARHRREQKRLRVEEALADRIWNELYECEQSLEQWRDMVIANQDLFWAEAAKNNRYDWDRVGKARGRKKDAVVCPVPRLLEFTHFNLSWSDMVGNTHSRPHNGVENWGGRVEGAPRGYPGWCGRVEWIVAWPKEWDGFYLGSSLFSGSAFGTGRQRAWTGTGGGGGMRFSEKHGCYVQSFGYDFRVFAADWPGLARYYEKRRMWGTLSNNAVEFA